MSEPELTASHLFATDEQLINLQSVRAKYSALASEEVIATFKANAEAKKFPVYVVSNKKECLEKLISLVPDGSTIFSTGSTSLSQIGYTDYAKNNPDKWVNLKAQLLTETDEGKKSENFCCNFILRVRNHNSSRSD